MRNEHTCMPIQKNTKNSLIFLCMLCLFRMNVLSVNRLAIGCFYFAKSILMNRRLLATYQQESGLESQTKSIMASVG